MLEKVILDGEKGNEIVRLVFSKQTVDVSLKPILYAINEDKEILQRFNDLAKKKNNIKYGI